MEPQAIEIAKGVLEEAALVHRRFAARGLEPLVAAAAAIRNATDAGRRVFAFGNGGSATDAQHLVAELVGRFETERPALAGIALTADTSVLTAVANDYSYEHVFSRQIEALGCRGDVAVGISTSGRSSNVERALASAKTRGLVTIALTGRDGGLMGAEADIHVNVAETSTARIQEVHRTVLHAICKLVDLERARR